MTDLEGILWATIYRDSIKYGATRDAAIQAADEALADKREADERWNAED